MDREWYSVEFLRLFDINLRNIEYIIDRLCWYNPHSMKYASIILKHKKEFVMDVIGRYGNILQYLPINLKDDEDIVRKATKDDKAYLIYASPRLQLKFKI